MRKSSRLQMPCLGDNLDIAVRNIMALYEIYMTCSECDNLHSVQTKIELIETDLDKLTLSEYFADREIPSSIKFIQGNKYRCPHTKGLYAASDLGRAYFIVKE